MVELGTARLVGAVIVVGLVAIGGTSLVFGQDQTQCVAPAYYVGCSLPLSTAQVYGAAIVGGLIVFSVAVGVALPPHFRHPHDFK